MHWLGDPVSPLGDFGALIDDFAQNRWSVVDQFLPSDLVFQLAQEAEEGIEVGAFRQARVGRGEHKALRSEIRQDRVCWLEPQDLSCGQQIYWDCLDALRLEMNRSLFLGLFDFEAHFAVFPPNARYKKHLDQFQGVGLRTVSCILYLTDEWQDEDGGALRLYLGGEYHDIYPTAGRFVCFLSGEFYHEVLPATRRRLSLTGWFRKRADLPIVVT